MAFVSAPFVPLGNLEWLSRGDSQWIAFAEHYRFMIGLLARLRVNARLVHFDFGAVCSSMQLGCNALFGTIARVFDPGPVRIQFLTVPTRPRSQFCFI